MLAFFLKVFIEEISRFILNAKYEFPIVDPVNFNKIKHVCQFYLTPNYDADITTVNSGKFLEFWEFKCADKTTAPVKMKVPSQSNYS